MTSRCVIIRSLEECILLYLYEFCTVVRLYQNAHEQFCVLSLNILVFNTLNKSTPSSGDLYHAVKASTAK